MSYVAEPKPEMKRLNWFAKKHHQTAANLPTKACLPLLLLPQLSMISSREAVYTALNLGLECPYT